FDHIVVGVATNPQQRPCFSHHDRLTMVQETFAALPQVEVAGFEGLLVSFAKEHHACAILRGLRAASDFEYEFQMATMNRHLDSSIETAFVMAREDYTFVSSRFIREISAMGGDVSALLPEPALRRVG
ncbi:MAG: pantetheine-phosphate adenylyltransferase, partial [Mariprofundales bacterium]|nr:pantetheine-phosphate adenylyltransferase [Mariprofundales bacterium]